MRLNKVKESAMNRTRFKAKTRLALAESLLQENLIQESNEFEEYDDSKYFIFHQNNSGGNFTYFYNDEEEGVRIYGRGFGGYSKRKVPTFRDLIIKAKTREEAIVSALEIGIYFGGVSAGIDCECCGNRWYGPSEVTLGDIYQKNTELGVLINGVIHPMSYSLALKIEQSI